MKSVEIWKIIPDFPKYEASNCGRIRRGVEGTNTKKGFILKYRINKSTGYFTVGLQKDGATHDKSVHIFVASAFLGKRPRNYVINHKDGIKTNNSAENLEYVTFSENLQHAAKLGLMATGKRNGSHTKPEKYPRGEQKYNAKLTDDKVRKIRKLIAKNHTGKYIANLFDIHEKQVSNIRLCKTWKHVK